MTSVIFRRLNNNQKGFTLVELLAAIAITAVIAPAVTAAIYQLYSVYAQVTNRITVNNQVANAVQWITSDSQMAQKITVENGTTPDLRLNFLQYSWDNSVYNITYTITNDNQMQREYTKTYALGTGIPPEQSTIVVARYVDTGNTSCSFNSINPTSSDFGILTFQITARIEGFKGDTATSRIQVITRFFLYKRSVLYDG